MKDKLLIGIAVGLVLGLLLGRFLFQSDAYSISVLNQYVAIKINKRSGETWRFDMSNDKWARIETEKSN